MDTDLHKNSGALFFLSAAFFLCGLITVFNGILLSYLKPILQVGNTLLSLIPIAFYTAYLLCSPVVGTLFKGKNILKGLRAGLFIGFLAFPIVLLSEEIPNFFTVVSMIFILGIGIATIQVCGNPYVMQLRSDPAKNMILVHAATALGMIVSPYLGSFILFEGSFRLSYSLIGLISGLLLLISYILILPEPSPANSNRKEKGENSYFPALKERVVLWGMAGIAAAVGVEVSCAYSLLPYLSSGEILHTDPATAGRISCLFWILFTGGRILGPGFLKKFGEEKSLFLFSASGMVLCTSLFFSSGYLGAFAVLSLGFSCSILFPVIFGMTLEKCKADKTKVSGLLCMANIGGAFFPLIQSLLVDHFTLIFSMIVPFSAFAVIALYSIKITKRFEVTVS